MKHTETAADEAPTNAKTNIVHTVFMFDDINSGKVTIEAIAN